jgi:hypothetical protein
MRHPAAHYRTGLARDRGRRVPPLRARPARARAPPRDGSRRRRSRGQRPCSDEPRVPPPLAQGRPIRVALPLLTPEDVRPAAQAPIRDSHRGYGPAPERTALGRHGASRPPRQRAIVRPAALSRRAATATNSSGVRVRSITGTGPAAGAALLRLGALVGHRRLRRPPGLVPAPLRHVAVLLRFGADSASPPRAPRGRPPGSGHRFHFMTEDHRRQTGAPGAAPGGWGPRSGWEDALARSGERPAGTPGRVVRLGAESPALPAAGSAALILLTALRGVMKFPHLGRLGPACRGPAGRHPSRHVRAARHRYGDPAPAHDRGRQGHCRPARVRRAPR